jgi:hypothetical protein
MNKLLDWIVKLEFPFAFDVVGQLNANNWEDYQEWLEGMRGRPEVLMAYERYKAFLDKMEY